MQNFKPSISINPKVIYLQRKCKTLTAVDRILQLYLILENKTNVVPGDNVVQLSRRTVCRPSKLFYKLKFSKKIREKWGKFQLKKS
jgi:hypothetical protein